MHAIPLVIVGELGGLSSNPLEQIIDEAVHDAHGTAGDTSVWVHLLQHFVDVDAIALLSASTPLSCCSSWAALGLACLLCAFTTCFGCHSFVLFELLAQNAGSVVPRSFIYHAVCKLGIPSRILRDWRAT